MIVSDIELLKFEITVIRLNFKFHNNRYFIRE